MHTHLDHVLDAAVGMLFNHRLDPDQGLDLSGRVKMALRTSRFTKPCFTEGKLRARDHRSRCEPSTLLLGAPQLVPGWVRALEKMQTTSPRTLWWGCLGKGQWCQRGLAPQLRKFGALHCQTGSLEPRLLMGSCAHPGHHLTRRETRCGRGRLPGSREEEGGCPRGGAGAGAWGPSWRVAGALTWVLRR